ncbi:unnamed protein product [Tuber melanosporum]|uniref:(Perigord truffle) hypothetical protein n=1 Tax=Tuber melanosporum (strain Mel28) TaxID=656061 RepID=D5GM66_TUBMM|nr:uncharacterized protein GSTUM_00010545001 [Tuber melanosporum]CAZ85609.1 unnamed protein product [Tuber melanosporum]
MRFFTVALGTVVAFAALISAQTTTGTGPPPPAVTDSTENQINVPPGGTIASGSGITIRWTPSTPGPVTLILRRGDGNNLATVTNIASEIPNSGSYDWTPSESLPVGDDYSIQIISGSASNYSPKFGIGPPVSTSSSSTSTTTSTGSSSTSSSSSSSSSTITSSSSSSSATTSATSSGANTTISSTSRTSSRSIPTSTSSGATGGATSTNGAAQVVSPLALVFFIAAGIAYLN